MAWFKRKDKKIKEKNKKSIPDGLWEKCPSCSEILFKPEINKSLFICHHCNYHFRMDVENWVRMGVKLKLSCRAAAWAANIEFEWMPTLSLNGVKLKTLRLLILVLALALVLVLAVTA